MTATLPLYTLGGLLLAAATLGTLLWRRGRGPGPAEAAGVVPVAPGVVPAAPGGVDYETLFTLSPHPMFVYEVQTLRFLAANGAALRCYGYTREEFLALALADIRPPEDVPAMRAIAQEVRKSQSVALPGVWRHRRKDGSVFHVRISGHDLRHAGRAARMVQVIDVSAEIALQAERDRMIAKLQTSREWLATAINAGRIALWERDLVARTLVLGGRWGEILGIAARSFGPVTEQSFIELCHPDDLPRVAERFKHYLRNPAEPYADEFRLKHALGHWIWVLSHGKVADRGSDGRPRRVVGTYVDISDLKAAQDARERQQAAEQASSMKSQFLGRVSHELRTPLNAVLGFSQLMQLDEEAPLTPAQKERVAHIERAGQHLLGLITDLMDLSRIELGAVELQSLALDPVAQMEESLALVDTQLREHGLTVEREFESGLRPVQADPLRLRQCLLNLLSNAIKYSHAQGCVRVGAQAVGEDAVELWVWNSGDGLTAQQLERLYEPFNRLGRDRSHRDGTGIGLAISRQLIERMGGHIAAESQPGVWARFGITLRAS